MQRNRFNIGDRVAYSRAFLRSIACYTGDLPFARGTVTAVTPFSGVRQLVTVNWSNPDVPERVLDANLVRVDRLHLEPA